jgi:hypothetical protein
MGDWGKSAVKIETCKSCGVKIGENEQAYVRNQQILCEKCYAKLTKGPQSRRMIVILLLSLGGLGIVSLGGLGISFLAGRISSKYEVTGIRNLVFSRTMASKHVISVDSVSVPSPTWIYIKLKNISGRNISGAIGTVFIFDQFGECLLTSEVPCDEPILAGETLEMRWFCDATTNVRTKGLIRSGKVTAEFVARKVIYTDGTQDNFEH